MRLSRGNNLIELKYMIANLIRGQFCVLFYQILMLVFL